MAPVEIDDRVRVSTPEGVDVDLVVAGLGSRFMSSLVDTTIQALVIIPLLFAASWAGTAGPAVASLGTFLAVFALPTAFDAFAGGRTPGRRLAGLRLVMADGSTVGLVPAAVRNIVRPLDFLPSAYSVGVISVLATDRNQRLGDLAAGTIVVRQVAARRTAAAVPGAVRPAASSAAQPDGASGWDLTGVTAGDVAVVRSFLARRGQLDPGSRQRVATDLARRLEPVVVGPDRSQGDEAFLEKLLAAKEARSR